MWVNVKRAETARNAFVGGQQMYVEYMIPARVRHPFPVVLVHGGGGQGTDWMGTPDGRPGWFQYLAQEGFKVYVVDRPGHGRSPLHPDLHGGFPAQARAREHRRPLHAAERQPGGDAERVSEEPHAVAGPPGTSGRPISISSSQGRAAATSTQPPPAARRGGRQGGAVPPRRGWRRSGGGAHGGSAGAGEPGPAGPAERAAHGVARRRAPICSTRSVRRSS